MDVREVLGRLGPRAVASHETAARAWRLDLLDRPQQRVTVPRDRSRVLVPGWEVRRVDLPEGDVVLLAGLRVTTVPRTVVDLAAVLPLDEAVAAADSAVRHGLVRLPALVRELQARRGRHAAAARRVALLVRDDSGSALESLMGVLFACAGLPAPVTQRVVREPDGRFVARVDFAWEAARLVVEADGFAWHSDRGAYRRDRERLNALERLGWRVLRFTWQDVRARPQHVVATVAACLAATGRDSGTGTGTGTRTATRTWRRSA